MELYVPRNPPTVLTSQVRALLPSDTVTVPDPQLPPWVLVIATGASNVIVVTPEGMRDHGQEVALAAAALGADNTYVISLPDAAGWLVSHLKEAATMTHAPSTPSAPEPEVKTRTTVPGLPEGEHPLANLVPDVDPLRLSDCCSTHPVVAVLLPGGEDPMLFCGHHVRKHWAVLNETLIAYRVIA